MGFRGTKLLQPLCGRSWFTRTRNAFTSSLEMLGSCA